jgi:drug/metabolite transporter (DMT)-like permease
MEKTEKKELKWTALMLLVFLIWGSFYPVAKFIVSDVHPLFLAFLRYFFALLPMVPLFLREMGRLKGGIGWKDLVQISFLGFLGVTLFAALLFKGIELSNAGTSSILANTQPVFATLLAPLLTSERFTLRQFGGILLGVVGMGIVVIGGTGFGAAGIEGAGLEGAGLSGTGSLSFLLGNLLCIGASLAISLYYILMKRFVAKYGSIIPTTISFFSGMVVLFLFSLLGGADMSAPAAFSPLEWAMVAYNGMVATALVYLLHNRSLVEIGVIKTIRLKFLIPVFGVLLSIIFLGEATSRALWVGMGVVILATVIIQMNRERKPSLT